MANTVRKAYRDTFLTRLNIDPQYTPFCDGENPCKRQRTQ